MRCCNRADSFVRVLKDADGFTLALISLGMLGCYAQAGMAAAYYERPSSE